MTCANKDGHYIHSPALFFGDKEQGGEDQQAADEGAGADGVAEDDRADSQAGDGLYHVDEGGGPGAQTGDSGVEEQDGEAEQTADQDAEGRHGRGLREDKAAAGETEAADQGADGYDHICIEKADRSRQNAGGGFFTGNHVEGVAEGGHQSGKDAGQADISAAACQEDQAGDGEDDGQELSAGHFLAEEESQGDDHDGGIEKMDHGYIADRQHAVGYVQNQVRGKKAQGADGDQGKKLGASDAQALPRDKACSQADRAGNPVADHDQGDGAGACVQDHGLQGGVDPEKHGSDDHQ